MVLWCQKVVGSRNLVESSSELSGLRTPGRLNITWRECVEDLTAEGVMRKQLEVGYQASNLKMKMRKVT